jgi:hypothetical protein
MLEVLKKVVSSTAVRNALLALILAVLSAIGLNGCGAGALTPRVQAQLDLFQCQLDAFESALPLVGAAEDLAMAARVGNIQYVVAQLLAFGLDVSEIEAVADAFKACGGPAPVAEAVSMPDAGLRI